MDKLAPSCHNFNGLLIRPGFQTQIEFSVTFSRRANSKLWSGKTLSELGPQKLNAFFGRFFFFFSLISYFFFFFLRSLCFLNNLSYKSIGRNTQVLGHKISGNLFSLFLFTSVKLIKIYFFLNIVKEKLSWVKDNRFFTATENWNLTLLGIIHKLFH